MLLLEQFINKVYCLDALTFLRQLPDESIHCIITSPPYFGLRSYLPQDAPDKQAEIGLEQTPHQYVERLVVLFREARRVLRSDGTLWVNIADSYGANYRWGGRNNVSYKQWRNRGSRDFQKPDRGFQGNKNLLLIPPRVAIGLQDDGWIVRSDIIWNKINAMPECLDPQTTVFVRRNGWVSKITLSQLANLKELPEILSPNGWVQVRHVWKTQKPAMALEAGKVERVICSPDHRFPVSSDRRRNKTRNERAEDIRHEGYADYLLYNPINSYLPETLTTWMGKPLDYNTGYLIGVYAAEGGHEERGFRIKITINQREDVFTEKIKAAANCLGLAVTQSDEDRTNSRNLFITEEWFTRTIDTFVSGKVTNKALNIEVILNTLHAFRQGMLDGYVEGDGSDRKGGGWIIASASRRLRDDVSTLASSVGIITSKGWSKIHDDRTGKTYNAHSLWTPYMTKRKAKSGVDGVYQVPPRRRKDLGDIREMIDIEVDGHLFLIGDGLVTHNSVTDRPTKSHEYVYLLAKSERYFYDAEAIREPNSSPEQRAHNLKYAKSYEAYDNRAEFSGQPGNVNNIGIHARPGREGRNARSVWAIATEPSSVSHYAMFPQVLVRRMILAGCPTGGIVLDMFAGSGTTGVVAQRFNRNFVLCDLNPVYVEIAQQRLKYRTDDMFLESTMA